MVKTGCIPWFYWYSKYVDISIIYTYGNYSDRKDSYILRTKCILNFYLSIHIYFVDHISRSNHQTYSWAWVISLLWSMKCFNAYYPSSPQILIGFSLWTCIKATVKEDLNIARFRFQVRWETLRTGGIPITAAAATRNNDSSNAIIKDSRLSNEYQTNFKGRLETCIT